MDKGTQIRSIVLVIALINQFLVAAGLNPIPGSESLWGEIASAAFTAVAAGVAWFRNNYLTWKGKKQRKILLENNLTK